MKNEAYCQRVILKMLKGGYKMEKKICENCKIDFEYKLKEGYPRKYCPKCSAEKKAAYESGKTQAPAIVPANELEGYTDRDRMIIAQCLTKVWGEMQTVPATGERGVILETFNYFMNEL
jgi:hypothetical protein